LLFLNLISQSVSTPDAEVIDTNFLETQYEQHAIWLTSTIPTWWLWELQRWEWLI